MNVPNLNNFVFCRLWDEYEQEEFAESEVSDGVISVPALIKKVKRIVTFFNKSPKNTAVLKKELKKQGKGYRSLVQDVTTRWNSTFYLLERFNDASDSVNVVLSKITHDLPKISAQEYKLIPILIEVLKLFEELTVDLSGEQSSTISMIIPYVNGLYENLWQQKNKFSTEFKEPLFEYQVELNRFINALIDAVDKKLLVYEEKPACV